MIDQNLIKTIALKQQTSEVNVRREYVQHLFLSYFYRQRQTNKIFFKGGTALRLIYGSPRFSEDLDFSSTLILIKPIETAALEALNAIEKEGIKTAIEESKITAGGYLGVFSFTLTGVAVWLKLEISSRDKQVVGEPVTVVGDFLPAYTVMILKQEQLIAQKITARTARIEKIEMVDSETGDIYCTWVQNGEWQKIKGECGF